MKLYGIRTCDACRKALKALEAAGYEVTFRDLRNPPLSSDEWAPLRAAFGGDLLNRRSTTWRALSETERDRHPDDLLSEHPTLMKRPVVQEGERLTLGWDRSAQSAWGV